MMSPKNLIVIYPLSSLKKRTRLAKLAEVATNMGITVTSWCWERLPGEAKDDLALPLGEKHVLLRGGGWSNPNLKYWYFLWMLRVFWGTLRTRPQKTVYCLGFESAFPVWVASWLTKTTYIFDDADRFSMIIRLPGPLQTLLRYLERKTSENSMTHIIPGKERYEFTNAKQFVIKNTPDKETIEKSKHITVPRPDPQLVIYVNGWLKATRGISTLIKVAEQLQANTKIHFLVAGSLEDEAAKQFVKLSNVTYLGQVDNATALAGYRSCDLVFTFYDPAIPINKYAESNKWGDALFFGIPVIVNDEVLTADFLRKSNACISVPYHDSTQLTTLLLGFANDTTALSKLRSSITQLRKEIKFFDEEIGFIFGRLHL